MYDTTTLRAAAPIFSRYAGLVARTYGRLRRELRIRKAIRDLQQMPEHLLRDLGLSQSDIPYVVRHGTTDRGR
jgi:uncharacterized protein YjiS (DUF1127 family)